ncbi:hypothetical protein M9Y10_013739 [Tritrichomonas musculus]|uniref:Importin N-terminal domain-containing protein n=1 Tax=Tritrichomonas musculus TaxID=1915356 RepID=A0ABR2KXM3_9EUKA
MEENIKLIFNNISAATDTSSLQQAQAFLDSFWENSDFYQALFKLFRNANESYNIRLMAIFEIKRQIKLHWNNFSSDFQQIFLNNITNLIIGITTQEPQYHSHVSDLIFVLLSLTFKNYFTSYWVNLTTSFIMSDEDHFYSGLLILINVFQIIKYEKYISYDEFKEQFFSFLLPLFEKTTMIFAEANSNLFLKTQCLIVSICTVEIFPEICLRQSFAPWYLSVQLLVDEQSNFIHPFNEITAIYMSKLVKLFDICQRKVSKEVPFSTQLLLLSFNIMYHPSWPNNSNQSFIINIFTFFFYFNSNFASSWNETFLPKLPEIIQNVFLPVFSMPAESIELVINDPFSFIIDYHVDNNPGIIPTYSYREIVSKSNNSNEEEQNEKAVNFNKSFSEDFHSYLMESEDSITAAQAGSICLCEICLKHPETHELLYSIPVSTLSNFMTCDVKDFLSLYSIFQMVSSYWCNIVLKNYDMARAFMDQLLPLFQVSINNPSSISTNKAFVYIFQSSLLLIISCANPYITHKNVEINPSYAEVCIALLDSESSLVQYFASYALHNLLLSYSDEYDAKLIEVCQPHALKVINSIIQLAQKYGIPKVTDIITILLKDSEILKSVIDQAPYLIESVFGLASSLVEEARNYNDYNVGNLFNTLTSLIDELDYYPQQLENFCTMIFKKCIDSFFSFCDQEPFFELIALILRKSPNYIHELYNLIFQPIVKIIPNFKKTLIFNEISIVLHNMMIRSPEFMISMNKKSIESIINNNNNQNENCNSLFEIGNIIINIIYENDCIDTMPINTYFSSLLSIIPSSEVPPDFFEDLISSIVVNNEDELYLEDIYYDTAVDMLLMLLSVDTEHFIKRDDGKLLNIYLCVINLIDVGCAVALANQFIPIEARNKYIAQVALFNANSLLQGYAIEYDDKAYAIEYNCILQKDLYIKIFSKQQKFAIFQNYLRELASNDPNFMSYFNEKAVINLIDILNFQLQ